MGNRENNDEQGGDRGNNAKQVGKRREGTDEQEGNRVKQGK